MGFVKFILYEYSLFSCFQIQFNSIVFGIFLDYEKKTYKVPEYQIVRHSHSMTDRQHDHGSRH